MGNAFGRRHRVGRAHRPRHPRGARPRRPTCRAARPGPAASPCSADGVLVVVFGRHAHRLGPDLDGAGLGHACPRDAALQQLRHAARRPPRHQGLRRPAPRPGRGVDAGGTAGRAGRARPRHPRGRRVLRGRPSRPSPGSRPTATPSTSSATTRSCRARWDGSSLVADDAFAARYRTLARPDPRVGRRARRSARPGSSTTAPGPSATPARSAASAPTTAPLHLVRVDLATAAVTLTEVCGRPGGLIANPPLVDEQRRIVVGYDSRQRRDGRVRHRRRRLARPRWSLDQDHASHLLHDPVSGLFLSGDHDAEAFSEDLVVRDIETGDEVLRAPVGQPAAVGAVPRRRLRPQRLRRLVQHREPPRLVSPARARPLAKPVLSRFHVAGDRKPRAGTGCRGSGSPGGVRRRRRPSGRRGPGRRRPRARRRRRRGRRPGRVRDGCRR